MQTIQALTGIQGRYPFLVYIPNKRNKYKTKIVWLMTDVRTKYVLNAIFT